MPEMTETNCVSRKEGERGLANIENSVDAINTTTRRLHKKAGRKTDDSD